MGAFQAGLILLRMEDYPKADDLSGTDVLVLATLFSFADDDDRPQAFPSASKIAARSRLGVRTVERCLPHLEKVGVIRGEHRHRRPTRWSLDPFFLKAGGVTEAGSSVREAEGIRQRGGQHTSQRRSAGVTAADQGTEVSSGAKAEELYGRTTGSSDSGNRARSRSHGSSAPPPGEPPGPPLVVPGPPPGAERISVNGVPVFKPGSQTDPEHGRAE